MGINYHFKFNFKWKYFVLQLLNFQLTSFLKEQFNFTVK